MNEKPIIGITVDCQKKSADDPTPGLLQLNWNYAQAIAEAGGVPIAIPPTADAEVVSRLIDGWLIPGGDDIDAREFGEENHPKVVLQNPARFAAERALMARISPEMPVFGICYGCQFLNVSRGGSIEQHVPDRVGDDRHAGGTLAEYCLEPESRLTAASGARTISGKSYHHQAVGRLGAGMRVVATHEDGTIEGIEADDRPWMVGVQWHLERTLDDPATRNLFRAFVEAATAYRRRKSA